MVQVAVVTGGSGHGSCGGSHGGGSCGCGGSDGCGGCRGGPWIFEFLFLREVTQTVFLICYIVCNKILNTGNSW